MQHTVLLHVLVQILSESLGVVQKLKCGEVHLVIQTGSFLLSFLSKGKRNRPCELARSRKIVVTSGLLTLLTIVLALTNLRPSALVFFLIVL
jgi:hypothetical protein